MSGNMEGAQEVGATGAAKSKAVKPTFDCMRTHEVARKLGISHVTVMRLLRAGKLPGAKIGRNWVVRKAVLDQYLRDLTQRIAEQRGIDPDLDC